MNEKALRTLEYDKIIQKLEDAATSVMGKALARELKPSSDPEEIERLQGETTDARARLFRKGNPSFGSVRDIRPSLARTAVGSPLSIPELLAVASLLENTARVKSYGRHDREDEKNDRLDPMFDLLEPLTPLSGLIRRSILSEDEVADDASPALRQIRRKIGQVTDQIHTTLNSFLNGPKRTYLMDAVITMRNNRYCVPVKAEYKGAVPGMVHDQSSTGATLFIEPMSIVKLNNDIRELEIQEQKEIEKILAELSQEVGLNREYLEYDVENMAALDFIFARAKLSLSMNASEPVFNTEGRMNLRQARHPLIDKKKVVPIDLRLGDQFDLLVVTGPNTGGKTVSLKTCGLLCLMGQAGLHIPANDRSELPVFSEIYADIGDEQSIEQSLSTFSAHMTNIVSFLEKAGPDSLVLFDELGAGTDPTEGAALAQAILNYLHHQHIRTMATTHYSELKIYALKEEGVENASCEFDVATLRPTYRLLIGVPGKSNAFEISRRLGLPDFIIDAAREEISQQDESFEDVLTTLEQNRITMERQQAKLQEQKRILDSREASLHQKEQSLEERKDQILDKARGDANRLLQEAKDFADQTMKDFRRFGKKGINAEEMDRRRSQINSRIKKTAGQTRIKPVERKTKELQASDLHLGDSVHVLSLNLKGIVSTLPDSKGNLFVQMGIIRSKINIHDLELIDDDPVVTSPALNKTGAGKIRMSKSFSVSSEINLLGKTVSEAVAELDKYLDDAALAHLKSVRIIHGKGTGALRKGVQDYLRRNKHVKAFHQAEYGEGDAGVTIAELK